MSFFEAFALVAAVILWIIIPMFSLMLALPKIKSHRKERHQTKVVIKLGELMNESYKGKSVDRFADMLKRSEIRYSAWKENSEK